jgi:hypothetical protein
MPVYEHHFTLDEANALLPRLRGWFRELAELDERLAPLGAQHAKLLEQRSACNVGGRELGEYLSLSLRWRRRVERILDLGVQIKDIDRGLCDFPHLLEDGREVYLCWQITEPEVAWWHGIEEGFAGRRPLGAGRRRRPRRDEG